MAYHLERGESVIAGLKRVARDQLQSAGAELSGEKSASREEAIHEARKSIKKIRALMRLVRADLGRTYTAENARLRDVSRRLSELRDAFAIVETFDALTKKFAEDAGGKLDSIRETLMKERARAEAEEDVEFVVDEAARILRKASKRVKLWPLRTDGFAAIAPGLKSTFRAGRKTLARVRAEPRPENYHELRKRVKDHWYHMRLIEDVWTDVLTGYEKSLKDLETWLGEDHNLAVLHEKVAAEPARYGKPKTVELFFDLVDRYQKELRGHSLSLADRIYEEKPRDLIRRIEPLWETWRREAKNAGESPVAV